jgi:glycosyltransferase involved in cell wall biosynthesis
MTSRVSAILPVRNAAEYVHHALSSVFAQDRRPEEVVVVDGGSTDATLAIVAGFADVRVVHQTGSGLADARNLGIASTDGDFVAFLDADDRWTPGKTTRQVEWLEAHADVGVVAGMMVRVGGPDADGPPVAGMTPGAALIRRDALARVGPFDARHRIGCDTDWLMRSREADLGPVLIDDVVLHKGMRPDSLSRDVDDYRLELLRVARDAVRRREGRGERDR